MSKKFLIFFLIFFLPKNLFAADLTKIPHFFILEGEVGEARDGKSHGWDFSGWAGGEKNRLWLRSEKKSFAKYDEKSESQALYSRNIKPFLDVQFGVRHDFHAEFANQHVNYLVAGIESLKIYSHETILQFFLSDQGNYSARFKQTLDFLFTKKLIFQPYLEADFFLQKVEKLNVRSGLVELEAGTNLRYEVTKNFAPYVVFRYNAKTGGTRELAQKRSQRSDDFIYAAGLKFKF